MAAGAGDDAAFLERLAAAAAAARGSGALRSFESACEAVEMSPDGLAAPLRVASSLARKPRPAAAAASASAARPADPFEEPEEALVVERAWTATHSLLLNKFNVVEPHLLLVTRAYQSQLEPLDADDAAAAWPLLAGGRWMMFYNCGEKSGASQPHKHTQLVRWPFFGSEDPGAVPPALAALVGALPAAAAAGGGVCTLDGAAFAFEHAACAVDPAGGPAALAAAWDRLVRHLGLGAGGGEPHPRRDYNLLCTSRWALAVPRREADFCDAETGTRLPINSMAFAGSFFVKSAGDAAVVRRVGGAAILAAVTFPPGGGGGGGGNNSSVGRA